MKCWTPTHEEGQDTAVGYAWGGPDAKDDTQILLVCGLCMETARSFGMRVRMFKRYRTPVIG
jgi:hypothetical protein